MSAVPKGEQQDGELAMAQNAIDTARLLPHAPASLMSPLPLSNPNPRGSANPQSVDFLRAAHHVEREPTQLQATRISHDSSLISSRFPHQREQWWISDMDQYLAASRLCREEAMACSSLAAGVHWPFAERENRKKNKYKSLLLTCRALNAGTNHSWRGLKKLFSKQFMPFSNRDHRGLHHINTTISKRSLKALNVGGRKMDARIHVGANKRDFVLGCKKLQGKENIAKHGNEIREPSSIDMEICQSRLGSCEKNCKLQQGKLKKSGIKNKVHILLNKASSVALDVCDILNLE